MIGLLFEGIKTTFEPLVFLALFFGVGLGIFIGALPGLTATMGVAVLMPLTFGIPTTISFALLLGVYVGAIYGGSISAILLNTPGTPAAVVTVLDGYPMANRGEAAKALSTATISSGLGGLLSTLILILVAPLLAKFALRFSAAEYFALAVFGLTIVSSVSGKVPLKGLISGCLGLLVATIGMDPISAYPRYTWGHVEILNGFALIPVLIGMFALSEAFIQVENIFDPQVKAITKFKHNYITIKEIIRILPIIIKYGFLGAFIGSIPAVGAVTAAYISYDAIKRKYPDKVGTGVIEGIAAPESANNGSTGGALIPLLTLGIPGDAVAAILLGALILHGLQPGPLLFVRSADIVYAIFSFLIVGNLLIIFLGLLGTKIFCRIVEVSKKLIVPTIITLSIVGSFSINNNMFDVFVAIAAGCIGYIMRKMEFPTGPLVLALILGPMAETNFRKALMLNQQSISFLFTRPITVAILIFSIFSVVSVIRKTKYIRMNASED